MKTLNIFEQSLVRIKYSNIFWTNQMQCMSVSLPLLGEEEQILQHLKANERYCQIRAITSALA